MECKLKQKLFRKCRSVCGNVWICARFRIKSRFLWNCTLNSLKLLTFVWNMNHHRFISNKMWFKQSRIHHPKLYHENHKLHWERELFRRLLSTTKNTLVDFSNSFDYIWSFAMWNWHISSLYFQQVCCCFI